MMRSLKKFKDATPCDTNLCYIDSVERQTRETAAGQKNNSTEATHRAGRSESGKARQAGCTRVCPAFSIHGAEIFFHRYYLTGVFERVAEGPIFRPKKLKIKTVFRYDGPERRRPRI